jgi:riboflavin biosynthesis pyrimidine reductase
MLDEAPDVHNPTEAHNDAMGLPMEDVIRRLVDLLGATTVAAIGNVKETRAVSQWLSGEREPQRPHALRFALQLALMISNYTTRDIARAWFHGSNPQLEDRSPLAVLRDDRLEEAQAPLIRALRTFSGRNGTVARSHSNNRGNPGPSGRASEVTHSSATGVHNASADLRQ